APRHASRHSRAGARRDAALHAPRDARGRLRAPHRPAPARMNAPLSTETRLHPLWQLTLARLRLFFREPGAVFWTFGFPLVLSIALGIAFRNRPPEPVHIAVESAELSVALRSDQI